MTSCARRSHEPRELPRRCLPRRYNQTASQVERATLNYAFAKDDAARKHALEVSGALSHEIVEHADLLERTAATDLESIRFSQQVSAHEVTVARAALGQLLRAPDKASEQFSIQAPVTGKILRVLQKSESVVQPGTPLLEIGDSNALEIVIDILTSDAVADRKH